MADFKKNIENAITHNPNKQERESIHTYWIRFLDIYTRDCGKRAGVCNRFSRRYEKKNNQNYSDADQWRDLAIWFWDVHNEINLQVYKEVMKKKGQDCCTDQDEKKEIRSSSGF
jgi:hypothetical protein